MEIILNSEQEKAVEKLNQFLKHPTEMTITLSGYAGTGKTTCISHFLKSKSSFALAAPTHKAIKVLCEKTGKAGTTLHALLGLKPNVNLEDFDFNNPIFDVFKTPQLTDYDFIVLDECSMINSDLYKIITQQAKLYQTKIIFVGDEKQLPPVKEDISKAFAENDIIFLNKIERTDKDNPLMPLFSEVRENIHNKDFQISLEHKDSLVEDKGFQFFREQEQFVMEAVKLFPENRVLAWTNKEVSFYNYLIRDIIQQTEEPFIVGDILMSYGTNKQIINSEDYTVLDVNHTTKEMLKGYELIISDPIGIQRQIFVLDTKDEVSLNRYKTSLKGLLERAKKYKTWSDFYAYKEKINLMQDIYDNEELLIKKDIDYGYCLTCHRAQGSTYKNVSIILYDIMKNKNHVDRNKRLYVALTKASDKALIYRG